MHQWKNSANMLQAIPSARMCIGSITRLLVKGKSLIWASGLKQFIQ